MTDNIKTAYLKDLKAMKERGEFFPPKPADGGPAFPKQPIMHEQGGMTLREYFAGLALIANADNDASHDDIARDCYLMADAMLRAGGQPV
jgi:hypothetical protein